MGILWSKELEELGLDGNEEKTMMEVVNSCIAVIALVHIARKKIAKLVENGKEISKLGKGIAGAIADADLALQRAKQELARPISAVFGD